LVWIVISACILSVLSLWHASKSVNRTGVFEDIKCRQDYDSATGSIRHPMPANDSLAFPPAGAGATGSLFSGEKIRIFKKEKSINTASITEQTSATAKPVFPIAKNAENKIESNCKQFAVVTTINEPTEGILRVAALPKWCIVIVGDEQTPTKAYESLAKKDSVFYLSTSYQNQLDNPFVKTMPFRSFARKNIGFLYAIEFGAKVIFDFDDDNLLTALEDKLTVPPPFLWKSEGDDDDGSTGDVDGDTMFVRFANEPRNASSLAFNPYPYMGASETFSWPRGYPIDELKTNFDEMAAPKELSIGDIPLKYIGVLQSVCDTDPDNDAIFRMTNPKATEFTFASDANALPLLIPQDTYSPYNAQATTHLYSSFWGLYLPISVPGRVTDIWRSYITQRIMKDVGLHLVYTPPIVRHDRSPHNYLADFQAESDLYLKTSKLLKFLDNWECSADSLSERVYSLWVGLYEHDYIGLADVEAVEKWLVTLSNIGYRFPTPLQKNKTRNVAFARLQPSMNGQPYRARPYYKVNAEGKTYAEMDRHNKEEWKKWIKTVDTKKRPTKGAVIKLIVMTMDEWPLLQTWTLFHGELLGFENLYIIDGSKDPRCISFLRYARVILGVNVIFSDANLNELESIMSQIGKEIGGSSDYIIKVDTDEFLQVYDKETKSLKSSHMSQYLKELSISSSESTYLGYVQSSYPSRVACSKVVEDSSVSTIDFPLDEVREAVTMYKKIYNSNTIFETGINLGGHYNGNATTSRPLLGLIHYHSRCIQNEIENTKKACISHKFLDAADSDKEAIKKLSDLLGKSDMCGEGEYNHFNSFHKAIFYGQHLQCPDETEEIYYRQDPAVGLWNIEFRSYVKLADEKYRVSLRL